MTMRTPIGLSSKHSAPLIREGFEAFKIGMDTSPYQPGHSNYWWHQGWDAAAIAHAMQSPNERLPSVGESAGEKK